MPASDNFPNIYAHKKLPQPLFFTSCTLFILYLNFFSPYIYVLLFTFSYSSHSFFSVLMLHIPIPYYHSTNHPDSHLFSCFYVPHPLLSFLWLSILLIQLRSLPKIIPHFHVLYSTYFLKSFQHHPSFTQLPYQFPRLPISFSFFLTIITNPHLMKLYLVGKDFVSGKKIVCRLP